MRTDEDLRRWALANGATVTLADGSTFNASGRRVAPVVSVKRPEAPQEKQQTVAAPPTQPAPQVIVQPSPEIAAAVAEVGRAVASLSRDAPRRKWAFTVERDADGLIKKIIAEEDPA